MGYNYDNSEIVVINQLQEELIQFFQVLNKKDKSPYAPTSKKIALLLYIDAQRLKLANVELAAINGLTITIPCGKNNAGYKNYEHEISELKKNLDTSYNHIDGIQNLYEEQFSKNKYLLEQWNSHFSNQQKHIEAIKEITNAECESIYDDIDLLIANSNRFSLENLMNYTPQTWLNQHNQVVVKFIETLTQNTPSFKPIPITKQESISQENESIMKFNSKLNRFLNKQVEVFSKNIVDLEKTCQQRNKFYSKESRLATTIITCKKIPSCSYQDQRLKYNIHKDHGCIYNTLTHDQCKKLLSPSPQMQQEFDNELYHFLNEIIDQLKTEKMQSFNKIDDDLARNMNSQNGFDKYCLSCNEKDIENRKQICPNVRHVYLL
ncbi:13086_t:CDS:2 [Entrophospora sp. SA101]|nr:13086_t:CDS:2 [Entrophospora sp. SA101]